MKTTKKTVWISILSLIMFLCLGIATMTTERKVDASGNFSMVDGAAIRLDENHYGIKYIATLGGSVVSGATYYTMIIPYDYITTYSLTKDYYGSLYAALYNELTNPTPYIATMECTPFLKNTEYYIQGSLTTISYANINRNWFGICYYTTDSNETRTYATFNKGENIRDVVEVASIAINSNEYTGENLDILKSLVNQGINKANGVDEADKFNTASLSLSISSSSVNLLKKEEENLTLIGLPSGVDIDVSWSSDNDDIVSVSGGTIKAKAAGTATVTATCLNTVYSVTVNVTGGTSIMNFDTNGDDSQINVTSGNSTTLIVADSAIKDGNNLYDCDDYVVTSGSSVAVPVGANTSVTFNATMSNTAAAPTVSATDYVYVRFSTLGRLTKLTVNNLSGTKIREINQMSTCYLEQMTWYEIELNAREMGLAPSTTITGLQFVAQNANGTDVTLYIDDIYYVASSSYEAVDGQIINFTKANAIDYVSETSDEKNSVGATGASISVVTENIPQKSGVDVTSALKVNGTNMKGAIINFPTMIAVDSLKSITISMYLEYVPERVVMGFIDNKGGYQENWLTASSTDSDVRLVHGWKNYVFASSFFQSGLSGYISGVYISLYELGSVDFLDNYNLSLTEEAGKTIWDETITYYIDVITGFNMDWDNVDYSFSSEDDYDLYTASGISDATVSGIVTDSDAIDGYALLVSKVGTENDGEGTGGVRIAFNDLAVADYDYIYMRVKATGSNNFFAYVNGDVYFKAVTVNAGYAILDIKSICDSDSVTTLSSIEIRNNNNSSGSIYVDYINCFNVNYTQVDYNFSTSTDYDISTVLGNVEMYADVGASDGYCAKVSGTEFTVLFDDITIADLTEFKLKYLANGGYTIYLNVNDSSHKIEGYSRDSWSGNICDLLTYIKQNCSSETVISKLIFVAYGTNTTKIAYIDYFTMNSGIDYTQVNYDFSTATDYDLRTIDGTAEMYADAGASDGYCAKVSGTEFTVSFDDILIAEVKEFKLKYLANGGYTIYLNVNDSSHKIEGYNRTSWSGNICDLLTYIIQNCSSETVISKLIFVAYGTNTTKIAYIDYFTIVTGINYTNVNYDFSSATDYDLRIIDGTAEMYADAGASDGYCAKVSGAEFSVSFNDLVIADLKEFKLKYLANGGYSIYLNSKDHLIEGYNRTDWNGNICDLLTYIKKNCSSETVISELIFVAYGGNTTKIAYIDYFTITT